MNRCVYGVFIHLNSGEINTASIFDPFCEVVHAANKLIDPAYLDRHFSRIGFHEKLSAIGDIYAHIARSRHFRGLPERHHHSGKLLATRSLPQQYMG